MLKLHNTSQKRVMIFIALALMLVLPTISVVANTTDTSSNPTSEPNPKTRQTFTHTVFAEDITAEWCMYCPSASETLKDIYNSGDLDFYFVCMITQDADRNTISDDAQQRADDYNVAYYPTVEFDGGYEEISGGQSDETNYRNAIESCGLRTVPELDISLSASYLADEKILINVEVTNNDVGAYTGNLRVHIVEIESRYIDYEGNQYPYGFLDYAINKDISISPDVSHTDTVTWDSQTSTDGQGQPLGIDDPDNIIVIATVFNSERNIKTRPSAPPPNNYYFAYYADQTAAATLETDDISPTVSIIQPKNSDTVKGTIDIQADASDNIAVQDVSYRIDSQSWIKMTQNSPDEIYSASWDTKTVSDGTATIEVKAVDFGGNTAQDSISVTVSNGGGTTPDTTPPSILIQSPQNNENVAGTITIKAQVTDNEYVSKVQYRIDSGPYNYMYSPSDSDIYEQSWDTTTVNNGNHMIYINAADSAGNTNSDSVSVYVDNGGTQPPPPPTYDTESPVLIISEPTSGATIEGITQLLVIAYDNSGVSSVDYAVVYGSTNWLPLSKTSTNEWAIDFDTTIYPDEDYNIIFKAVDSSDNDATESITVKIRNDYYDTLKPSLKISVPDSGDTIRDSVDIRVEARDESGIRYVEYQIDSEGWLQMLNVRNNIYEATWDTETYKDGKHNLTIRAVDFSNNYEVMTLDLEVANTEDKTTDEGLPGFLGLEALIAVMIIIVALGGSLASVRSRRK